MTDDEGTTHRIWRVDSPEVHRSVAAALADTELLIADGHHRYETARTYAEEIGGDGDHRYTLMALSSLDDEGTTTFGYHRLLTGLDSPEKQQAVGKVLREQFEIEEVPVDGIDPAGEPGIGVFGYIDSHHRTAYRLRLKDISVMDPLLPDRSEAYRRLDAAILETLILREALGMSEADVEAKKGLAYTASTAAAIEALDGKAHAAFLMRPTPVEQVREVAGAGETMPPKSTYFFPKLLTGFAFNPLSYTDARGRLASDRGQDLHGQGRRRHHLALVRRPRAQGQPADRGLRDARRGRARPSG